MALPPYLLGPNAWASIMVQQQQQVAQAQMAAAQAHAAVAQAQAQAQAVAQAQAAAAQAQLHAKTGHSYVAQSQPPQAVPKVPEGLTEEKLQEKGKYTFNFCIYY